jgi:PAS domain S-box-containing protein
MTASRGQRGQQDREAIRGLLHQLAETEAALQQALGSDVDTIVDPDSGTSILLPRARARLHQELEQRVEARTAELQRANEELQQQNKELAAARSALDTERRRYQDLFDFAPDGYLVTDPKGIIQEANRAAAALLGAEPRFLAGKPLVAFARGEDGRLLSEYLARLGARTTPEPLRLQLSLHPRQGEPFVAVLTTAPVHDAEGRLQGLRWLVRDVSERVRMEEALWESEERFRLAAEFTHDWEYWIGPDGQYRFVSPSCQRITGYRPSEFLDDPGLLDRLVHAEDRPIWQAHREAEKAQGEVHSVDFRIRTRQGAERWIAHACQPVYGDDGTWLGWRGSNRDVTARKEAEAERQGLLSHVQRDRAAVQELAAILERERDILQITMENTGASLAYLDADLAFVRVNETYVRQSGHTREDLLGQNHFDLFPDAENQAIFEQVRDTGEAIAFQAKPFEYADQPERGVTYWDWTLTPVKDEAGQVQALVLSLLDVTDRIRAEQQQARHLARLQGLLDSSQRIIAQGTIEGLLQEAVDAARELTGARLGVSGHGYREGTFLVGASSRASELSSCPPGEVFDVERGGVYLDLLEKEATLRLSQAEMEAHPAWRGLPENHAPLRGLLGARLIGLDGQASGLIMVSDKAGDEFDAEDEAALGQLAAMTSLALQHIEARLESQLRAGELDALFESMTEAFALHEILFDAGGRPVDYRFLQVNAAFEELTGLAREDLLGKTVLEVLPDTEPFWIETYGRVAMTGEPVHFEQYSGALGRHYAVSAYRPTENQFATLFLDITERIESERVLRENEQKLRALFEILPVGLSILDSERTLHYQNPALGRILDLPPQAMQDESRQQQRAYLRPDGSPMPPGEFPSARAAEEGRIVRGVEIGVVKEDGSLTWVNVSAAPLPFDDWSLIVVTADVTEQMLARQRIEEISAEAQRRADELDAVFDAMTDAVIVYDAGGQIITANRAAIAGYGFDPVGINPGALGIRVSACYPDGRPVPVNEFLSVRALAGETVRDQAYLMTGAGGNDLHVLTSAAPLHHGGQIVGAVIAWRDITAQVKAEGARDRLIAVLETEQARLRAIFDSAPEGIVVADAEARILLTNPTAERLYAHPVPYGQAYESHGELQLCLPGGPPYDPRDLPLTRSALDGEVVREEEVDILWPDGQRRNLLINTAPIRTAAGEIAGAVGVFQDITERRRMAEALRRARDELERRVEERTAELVRLAESLQSEILIRQQKEQDLAVSEERFRQMAESIDEVFVLFDPAAQQFLYLSRAYETLWGRPRQAVYQDPAAFLDGVLPEDRQRLLAAWEEPGEGYDQEFRVERPDGEVRWIRLRAFPIHDEQGVVGRVTAVAQDRTAEKRAQAALIQAERLSMAGQLAASLAHEINNPIQSALGCLDLAVETLDEGQDPRSYLEVTIEALVRAGRVVGQLRSLYREPRAEVARTGDLKALLDNVLILTRKRCATGGIEVDVAVAEPLPPLALAVDGMQQVFLNLVLNAVEAMPFGGRLRIRAEAAEQPRGVNVRFTDDGEGMLPDLLDRLFEPFYTTKEEGLGLGLFVSQSIVQQHGGRIDVDSRVGQGTTFTVWLPAEAGT